MNVFVENGILVTMVIDQSYPELKAAFEVILARYGVEGRKDDFSFHLLKDVCGIHSEYDLTIRNLDIPYFTIGRDYVVSFIVDDPGHRDGSLINFVRAFQMKYPYGFVELGCEVTHDDEVRMLRYYKLNEREITTNTLSLTDARTGIDVARKADMLRSFISEFCGCPHYTEDLVEDYVEIVRAYQMN